jgi:hypothetical protein
MFVAGIARIRRGGALDSPLRSALIRFVSLCRKRSRIMQALNSLALAASAAALAFGALAAPPASAADMEAPPGQYGEGPPPQYYAPPPAEEGYAYPPPPAYAYPPPVAFVPTPYYYAARPYWRGWYGYGPRFAYGYGRWGRPYRRW